MYVVTVDLWPYGDGEKKKPILKIVGYNTGSGGLGYFTYENKVINDVYDPIPDDEVIQIAQRKGDLSTLPGMSITVAHQRQDGMAMLVQRILEAYDKKQQQKEEDSG